MDQKLIRGAREVLPHKTSLGVNEALKRSKALLVRMRYGNPAKSLKIIAITGTNGKATTAKYIDEMLQEAGQPTTLLTSEGNTPLGVVNIQEFLQTAKKKGSRYAILTLHSEDILQHSLSGILVDAVVVTNISETAHETTDRQIQAIERLLVDAPKHIVLNHDDPSYETLSKHLPSAQGMSYGAHADAEARIDQKTLYRKGGEVRLVVDHQTSIALATYLVGAANIYNLVAAVATLYVMGEKITKLDEGAARLERMAGNYEYVDVALPYDVVVDNTPNEAALLSVVASAHELVKRRLILVTQADMLSEATIKSLAKQTARLIIVDDSQDKNSSGVERVTSAELAIEHAQRAARQGDLVLCAGPMFVPGNEDSTSFVRAIITNKNSQDS